MEQQPTVFTILGTEQTASACPSDAVSLDEPHVTLTTNANVIFRAQSMVPCGDPRHIPPICLQR